MHLMLVWKGFSAGLKLLQVFSAFYACRLDILVGLSELLPHTCSGEIYYMGYG